MPVDGEEPEEEGAGSKRKPEPEDDPLVEDKEGDKLSQVCPSFRADYRALALGS